MPFWCQDATCLVSTVCFQTKGELATHNSTHTDDGEKLCNLCSRSHSRNGFSKQQWKRRNYRKCADCSKGSTPASPQLWTSDEHATATGVRLRPNNWGYTPYVDAVLGMKCFKDIAMLGVFPSSKDISESMGVLQAAGYHSKFGDSKAPKRDQKLLGGGGLWKHKRVVCLSIGDGTTPRTATLACFLTAWECVSIDPELDHEWNTLEPNGVRRLQGFRGTLDDWVQGLPSSSSRIADSPTDHLVLLCVHSHARFIGPSTVPAIREIFGNPPTTLVALPCCSGFSPLRDLDKRPDETFDDQCIFSAMRRIWVWNWNAGADDKTTPSAAS